MRYGFVVPFTSDQEFLELARLGEARAWDGVFTWETLYGADAWVLLGAAAVVTERVRLGTLLTPAARHRPWDLASSVGTVDRLSGGRAVMSVGLGAPHDGWTAFEPDEGRAVRARRLDECLAVYAGLLEGGPVEFEGEYYRATPYDFPKPALTPQRPHPPVWVVGAPSPGRARQPSLERAARWQGLIPAIGTADGGTRTVEAFAAVVEADSWGDFATLEPADQASWADAGATWWVESWWDVPSGPDGMEELRRRVDAGPPAG